MTTSLHTVKKIFILSILVLILVITIGSDVHIVSATTTNGYVPLAPIDLGPNAQIRTDLTGLIIDGFRIAVAGSAALAVIMIIVGGIQYMSTDAISGKKDGRNRIEQALFGLLLVMISFLVLETINPKIVDISLVTGNLNSTIQDPNAPTPPRAVNTNSNSGQTTIPELDTYIIEGHQVTAYYKDDVQNYPLTNLYTYSEYKGLQVFHQRTQAECDSVAATYTANGTYSIYQPCHEVTYWYVSKYGQTAGFTNEAECVASGNGPCASASYFDIGVQSVATVYRNYTQAACNFTLDKAKSANPNTDASCTKQSGPIDK